MSEEVKEGTEVKAKKKGKLPVILAVVVLVGGGGFFGMKMAGGAPKKVAVELDTKEPPPVLGEFLVNLQGSGNVYLRTELSLGLKEGYKKETLDKAMPALKNAVVEILSSKTIGQVNPQNWPALRRELATALNATLKDYEEKKPEAKDDKKEEGKEAKPDKGDKADASDHHEDWDSDTGPVLKIYFTSFATQ